MAIIKKTTVHIRRRGRRKRKCRHKAPKQSDDYHDGHNKHADRTAKFTRNFQTGEFGCFCFDDNEIHCCSTPQTSDFTLKILIGGTANEKIEIIFGMTLDFKNNYVLIFIGTVHNRPFQKWKGLEVKRFV